MTLDKPAAWTQDEARTEHGRAVVVAAAWVAGWTHPHWKQVFDRLGSRMSRAKAMVAVAHTARRYLAWVDRAHT